MSQGLFWKKVDDARRGDWCDSRIIATPLSRWVWTLLALALAGSLIAFLEVGHYIRSESVTGQLVPSAGLINLNVTSTGGVGRVWVHDGQTVQKGSPLVDISSGQNGVALGATQALTALQLGLRLQPLQQHL